MPQMTHTCSYCRTTFGIHLTQCPNCGTTAESARIIPTPPTQAFGAVDTFVHGKLLASRKPNPDSSAPQTDDDDTKPFRPIHRPAAAALCILFDGDSQLGEWRRLTNDETIIGRGDVDVPVKHDPAVSERHASLVRRVENGSVRWVLQSLDADAGVFVRTKRTALIDGDEFLIGSHRWRFSLPQSDAVGDDADSTDDATRSWRALSASDLTKLVPSLVEITKNGVGRTFALRIAGENRIGRARERNNIVVDDPFVSPCHLLISQDGDKWFLRDMESHNGTWIRIHEKKMDNETEFQLGEQRFRFLGPA